MHFLSGCAFWRGEAHKRVLGYVFGFLFLYLPTTVYSGTFPVFGPQSFQRDQGAPVTEISEFSVLATGTPYSIKLHNGGLQDDETNNEPVSSGEIKLNGVAVFGSNNFNQNVVILEDNVVLQADNTLAVKLYGKPGGAVTIEIVGVDNDLPTINASVDPAPDLNGWNNSPVTVSFECSDQTSGIASCPEPVLLSSAGENQLVSGTAVDNAGNVASTSISVNIHFDTDNDGVYDEDDTCPGTPTGESPDIFGCSASQRDTDSDGVNDLLDQCPGSPLGEPVDQTGCPVGPVDTDSDGVIDDFDSCPNSPYGEPVYADGCSVAELDSDHDGVADGLDICSGTAPNATVDLNGCGEFDNPVVPPEPAQIATPVEATVVSTVFETTAFLYSGNDPVQTGVFEGTIEPEQAAVTRGKVQNRFGDPVVGVIVYVADFPEYGETRSRSDGQFDMAVNGGGALTLIFEKPGYLPVHRRIQVPWQDYAVLPDVVMTPLDSKVTMVQVDSAEMQIAQGSPVSDEDGERQSTLMFSPGTTAEIVMPDGSTQALSQLSIRATEFTVGESGPQAMPAELPPFTAYTYAVELSVDEAISAGANTVQFSKPVSYYVDNFLSFPVGGTVPVGFYDREKLAWIPSDDGRVIAILGIDSNGLAELDVAGAGVVADAVSLAELGISNEELSNLAEIYEPGDSLWRVQISHFTPVDCNWPAAAREVSTAIEQNTLSLNLSDTRSESSASQTNPDCRGGSIIECQNQVLRETLSVTGSEFALNYRSDRVPGRTANNALDIPITGSLVPAALKRIEVSVTIAGKVFKQVYEPFPDQVHGLIWDGLDVYGRLVRGQRKARITIGYVYDGLYQVPVFSDSTLMSFGVPAGQRLDTNPTRQETIFSETREATVGVLDSQVHGLGGWTLDAHHSYDPIGHTVYLGTGERRSLQGTDSRVRSFGRRSGFTGDAPVAINATTGFDRYLGRADYGSTGDLYFIAQDSGRIRRLTRNNILSTVAGSGPQTGGIQLGGFDGDGGPATAALFNQPSDVVAGDDGSLYIADSLNHRVRKVSPDGIITTIAGSGPTGLLDENGIQVGQYSGDGGLATDARLNLPSRIAVAPDGTVYVVHRKVGFSTDVVRRITPDGVISTFAGNGEKQAANLALFAEGVLPQESKFVFIKDITVDKNGLLYIAEEGTGRGIIYQVTSGGLLDFVVARDLNAPEDGVPSEEVSFNSIRSIDIDFEENIYLLSGDAGAASVQKINPKGIIVRVLGKATSTEESLSGGALGYSLLNSGALAVAPDGTLVVPAARGASSFGNSLLVFMGPPFPGFNDEDIGIASTDGSLLYQFSKTGRHLKTINTLTGEDVYSFGYDSDGYLVTITDFYGNAFSVERGTGGVPTAFVSPDLHRTGLIASPDGYLTNISDPAGNGYLMTYNDGLLQQFRDPNLAESWMTYDARGKLLLDTNAENGLWDLDRIEAGNGYQVSMTSALGRARSYQVENLPSRIRQRSVTAPDGSRETMQLLPNNSSISQQANGVITTTVNRAEVRFGGQSFTPNLKTELPSGLKREEQTFSNTSLFDAADPFSVQQHSITRLVNGRVYSTDYDGQSRTYTESTPEGRIVFRKVDGMGRPLELTVAGLDAQYFTYDQRGRVIEVFRGTGTEKRSTSYTYDAAGWLESETDSLGRSTFFVYDTVGRITRQTLHDSREILYNYDSKGNLLSIAPPGRPAHLFNYDGVDQEVLYTPPSVSGIAMPQTVFDYNLDKQLTRISRPDGQIISMIFGASSGKLDSIAIPTGTYAFSYDPSSGQMQTVTAPDGGELSYSYDGFLVTGSALSGAVSGSVDNAYDNDFRITSRSVNGANTISFGYDNDGLLVQAGSLTIFREAQMAGLVNGSTLGGLSTSRTYNSFAEMNSYNASYGGSSLYGTNFTRDKLGRIEQKIETIEGATSTTGYVYDSVGRLVSETTGVTTTTYSYDSNGNRTHFNGMQVGTYDEQDRLSSYQTANYLFNDNGELESKVEAGETTSYQYDVLGNLRQVILPDGMRIDYVIDGQNRRVGKKIDGVLTQGFLYKDQLNPIVELDGDNNIVSRFIYGTKINVPDYMIKGGVIYRIISDHLGSPRIVVNILDGTIAQRIDYDTWGNVILDTSPGFQPFGFAGGIYDLHIELIRFGARDYDARTARWTSKDPIRFAGKSTNFYGYAAGNPVNFIDSNGKEFVGLSAGFNLSGFGHSFGISGTIAIDTEGDGTIVYTPEVGASPVSGGHGFIRAVLGPSPSHTVSDLHGDGFSLSANGATFSASVTLPGRDSEGEPYTLGPPIWEFGRSFGKPGVSLMYGSGNEIRGFSYGSNTLSYGNACP